MKKVLFFDVESTSLYGVGFAVGAVVMVLQPQKEEKVYSKYITRHSNSKSGQPQYLSQSTKEEFIQTGGKDFGSSLDPYTSYRVKEEIILIEEEKWIEIDSFELLSLEGANKANDWVKENVLPNLSNMPKCETDKDLRTAFFEFYIKHKENCEIWSDVNFPVETNFLSDIVRDAPKEREWSMPYPLKDMSTIVDLSIDRLVECGISGLRKHNPIDDSRASVYFLIKQISLNSI